jgi:lipoic acid synthetase
MIELPVIDGVVEQKVKKPNWLRVKLPIGESYKQVRNLVDTHQLHTICESGNCPNMGECWGEGTATFMILGNICTRSCGFCAVATGRPEPVDWDEPQRVAEAIHLMKVKHAVVTSVDRDEITDGGSIIWYNTIKAIKSLNPTTTLETLIPDFKAEKENIQRIIVAAPEVVSHNIETVQKLTAKIRSVATYDTSIAVLKYLSSKGITTKSGIMLGLGETFDEILETIRDIKHAGCSIITIGQYFQPSKKHYPVQAFITKDIYDDLKIKALELGFKHVESGILVRSSYHAETQIN